MSARMWITLKIVVTALFIFQYPTVNAQLRVNPKQDTKPCPDTPRSPFRYAITGNDVLEFSDFPAGPTVKSRGVTVLLDAKSLTEENLKQLFGLLSKRFPEPLRLTVSVYTNLEDILTPEEGEVIFTNCTLDVAKLTPEHPWAFYTRSSESERFTYHTKKPDEPPKDVVLQLHPFAGPKPLMIFIQSDPWRMLIGSDTPRVAIYENGDVIYVKKVNDQFVYYHVTLDTNELEKVREQLKPVLALKDLKSRYSITPGVTDQPEAMFYFRDGDRDITTSVYGLTAGNPTLTTNTEFSGRSRTIPPDELLKLYKWLWELDYPNGREWTPKYVEVVMWDFSHATEASIQWPKNWPTLNSDHAIKREDSMYSIFLDGSMLPRLREFLATRKLKGAVKIEGHKMIAVYRYTFPGEPTWRQAFTKARGQ